MDERPTAYGEWLRGMRKRLHGDDGQEVSQADIAGRCAERLSIYQSRLSEWERGGGLPTYAQALGLHTALECTYEQAAEGLRLLGETEATVRDGKPVTTNGVA